MLGLACGTPAEETRVELPPETLRPAGAADREQIDELERTLRELESSGASASDVAVGVGELGRLFHAFRLLDGAQICYEEAQRLDGNAWRWPYLLGYLHQTRGDLDRAARGFAAAIELKGDFPPALHRWAEVELSRGDLREAEALWRRAVSERADFAAALYGLGQVALNRGNPTAAVELLERALRIEPSASRGHHTLGLAYRDLGETEEATEHLRQGGGVGFSVTDALVDEIPSLPSGSHRWVRRGLTAVQMGDLERATESFRKAIELDPSNRAALHNLALALSDAGQHAEAAEAYRRLIALDPSDSSAHSALGDLAAVQGRLEEAVGHLRRAVQLAPDFKQARYQLAGTLELLGRWPDALAEYEALIELDPEFADVRVKRGEALVATGRREEGARTLQSRVVTAPENASAALSLSTVLRSSNRLEEAQRMLAQTLESGPFEPFEEGQLRLELGRILALRDLSSEALGELEEAQRMAPDLIETNLLIGLVQARLGRFRDAAQTFQAVLTTRPTFVPARLGLAQALQRQGRCADAITALEEGLHLAPSDRGLTQVLGEIRSVCSQSR